MRNKGELTERDRDELGIGDLPDDMLRERGEFPFPGPREGNIPPDMAGNMAAREVLKQTGIGGPVSDYNVRGVYDSRPVNGTDFYNFVNCSVAEGVAASFNCLQVPAGHVAVLRRVDFLEPDDNFASGPVPEVLPASLYVADYYVGITKNGGIVMPQNLEIPGGSPSAIDYMQRLPVSGPASVDCFIVYDEFEIIGLNVTDPTFDGGFFAGFYGNLLLKTGVPANFEVANKGAGKPTAVSATVDDLKPPPPIRTTRQASRPMLKRARKRHDFT